MSRKRLVSIGFAVLLAATSGPRQVWAHGGGGMGGMTDSDVCAIEKGNYLVHFSAYQHRLEGAAAQQLAQLKDVDVKRYLDAMKEEFQAFCREIPRMGKTTLTFDLIGDELRKIPVAIRVVEAAAEPGGSATVLYVPQQVYASGVVRTEANFAKAGGYTAIVEVEDHAGGSHGEAGVGAPHDDGGAEAVSRPHGSAAEEEAYHAHDATFTFPFRVGVRSTKIPVALTTPRNYILLLGAMGIGFFVYVIRGKRKKIA